jgi:hypothetical protein
MGRLDLHVEQIDKDANFSFSDVKLSHDACKGGRIRISTSMASWALTCNRCLAEEVIDSEAASVIISTGVDGQERTYKSIMKDRLAEHQVRRK